MTAAQCISDLVDGGMIALYPDPDETAAGYRLEVPRCGGDRLTTYFDAVRASGDAYMLVRELPDQHVTALQLPRSGRFGRVGRALEAMVDGEVPV